MGRKKTAVVGEQAAPIEKRPVEPHAGLLVMEKNGETIEVHPTQVGPWERQGWQVQ